MFTEEILHTLWPQGDDKAHGLREAIAQSADAVFATYEMDAPLVVAHAMAQFSHECGAGLELEENLNYSAQGLIATWPSRFDAAKAARFARQPRLIANEVYNGRMGNRPGTDDGWNFRGRGGSQVTGREGYAKLGQRIGRDLLANPDLVNDPALFLECAVADFVLCGCLPYAKADDVSGVTLHLNGGHIGLEQRKSWLARWKAALAGDEAPTPGLQRALNRLGANPPLTVDGEYGPATAAAVKAFQAGHGLAPDGKAGPQTMEAIRNALAGQ